MVRSLVQQVPSIVIEELQEPRRKLTLSGRALPTSGLRFGVTQRMDVYYAQGNPEGVLTLFGSQEDDTTVSGVWHSKYLGGAVTITTAAGDIQTANAQSVPATLDRTKLDSAKKLYAVFDEMTRLGSLIKFTWDDLCRVGVIEKFAGEFRTQHDVSWEANFKWLGRDDPRVSAVFTPQYADRSFARSLADRLRDIARTLNAPFTMSRELFDSWQERLNAVQSVYNTFRDVIDNYATGVTQPFAAARNSVDLLRRMMVGLEGMADDISEQSVESLCGVVGSLDAATGLSNVERLRAAIWKAETPRVIQTTASDIARALLTAESRNSEGDELTHIANSGETLRSLALLYYDNADEWRTLAARNGLASSALVLGQVVRIPERR